VPQRLRKIAFAAIMVAVAASRPLHAEPVFELTDGGRTFVYVARPGDTPGAVAAAFGIPPDALPAFLASNGIENAAAVPRGFRYRIPNPMVAELDAITAERAQLAENTGAARARVAELEGRLAALRAKIDFNVERRRRLETLERRWSVAAWMLALLIAGVAGAIALAVAAMRKEQQAERWARSLASEADERRRTGLAERQQTARRILELEAHVRGLEQQVPARVRAVGR
jgi:hypothetical protein